MILAKPIVENQYWILKKDNRKIGQLEVKENGNCTIKILDSVVSYKTIKMAREAVDIQFEPAETATPLPPNVVYGHEVLGDDTQQNRGVAPCRILERDPEIKRC